MSNALSVLRVFALILTMFSVTMLLPLAAAWIFDDGAQSAYDEGIVITLAAIFLLWWLTRRHREELKVRDGFLLVVLTWVGLPAFATIPLLAYYWPKLSFTDAYFETVLVCRGKAQGQHGRRRIQACRPGAHLPQVHLRRLRGKARRAAEGQIRRPRRPRRIHRRQHFLGQ